MSSRRIAVKPQQLQHRDVGKLVIGQERSVLSSRQKPKVVNISRSQSAEPIHKIPFGKTRSLCDQNIVDIQQGFGQPVTIDLATPPVRAAPPALV